MNWTPPYPARLEKSYELAGNPFTRLQEDYRNLEAREAYIELHPEVKRDTASRRIRRYQEDVEAGTLTKEELLIREEKYKKRHPPSEPDNYLPPDSDLPLRELRIYVADLWFGQAIARASGSEIEPSSETGKKRRKRLPQASPRRHERKAFVIEQDQGPKNHRFEQLVDWIHRQPPLDKLTPEQEEEERMYLAAEINRLRGCDG